MLIKYNDIGKGVYSIELYSILENGTFFTIQEEPFNIRMKLNCDEYYDFNNNKVKIIEDRAIECIILDVALEISC